jgi:hypothetical protein
MKSIWKFELEITDEQTVELPIGAEIIHVDVQENYDPDKIYMWAIVDPNIVCLPKQMENRIFRIVGTGHQHDFIDRQNYIGTVKHKNGTFMWHIFETLGK